MATFDWTPEMKAAAMKDAAKVVQLDRALKRAIEALEVIAEEPVEPDNGIDYAKQDRVLARKTLELING